MGTIVTLVPGNPVPDLALPLLQGGTWRLTPRAGLKYAIMVFYRGHHCPRCRAQLEQLRDGLGGFAELGTDVVAVSCDDRQRAGRSMTELNLADLKIAYDLPVTEAQRWGLFVSESLPGSSAPPLFSEPGLFLVKADGTLQSSWIQTSSWARPRVDDLQAMLASVLENDPKPRGTVVDVETHLAGVR